DVYVVYLDKAAGRFAEVPAKEWEEPFNRGYAQVTGAPKGVSAADWAHRHGQHATDIRDEESARDFTRQGWGGEVHMTLEDAEGLAKAFAAKIQHAQEGGDPLEAMAQIDKLWLFLNKVRTS